MTPTATHPDTGRHRDHSAFPVLYEGFKGSTRSPHTLAVMALDALTAAGYEVVESR